MLLTVPWFLALLATFFYMLFFLLLSSSSSFFDGARQFLEAEWMLKRANANTTPLPSSRRRSTCSSS